MYGINRTGHFQKVKMKIKKCRFERPSTIQENEKKKNIDNIHSY